MHYHEEGSNNNNTNVQKRRFISLQPEEKKLLTTYHSQRQTRKPACTKENRPKDTQTPGQDHRSDHHRARSNRPDIEPKPEPPQVQSLYNTRQHCVLRLLCCCQLYILQFYQQRQHCFMSRKLAKCNKKKRRNANKKLLQLKAVTTNITVQCSEYQRYYHLLQSSKARQQLAIFTSCFVNTLLIVLSLVIKRLYLTKVANFAFQLSHSLKRRHSNIWKAQLSYCSK